VVECTKGKKVFGSYTSNQFYEGKRKNFRTSIGQFLSIRKQGQQLGQISKTKTPLVVECTKGKKVFGSDTSNQFFPWIHVFLSIQ
jgi:hypothetical protein